MCEGCGCGCSETASSRMSHGRPPACSAGPDTFDAEYVALTPAPRRRVDHARPATRPRREGPGDGRTHRGAVLTGANHADARPRERICRNEGVEQSEINAAHCSLCVSYDSTARGGTSVQRCREPSEEVEVFSTRVNAVFLA